MKKRLLKVSTPYKQYLDWYDARHGTDRDLPYAEQLSRLLDDGFGWGKLWGQHLGGSGAFEVTEIVYNSDRLQQAWLREFGAGSKARSAEEILLDQIDHYAPDILFLHSNAALKAVAAQVRKRFGARMKIVGYDGVEERSQAACTLTDLMLVPVAEYAERYRALGVRAELLPYGFDEAMRAEIGNPPRDIDVGFIGGAYLTSGHYRRLEVLDAIRQAVPCDYWISGLPTELQFWRWTARAGLRRDWNRVAQHRSLHQPVRRLRHATRGQVYGRAMFEALARTKVSLNCHIDVAGGMAGNMRLYESAGLGACLLTDWKENLHTLYEPGREVVVYKTTAEAVALAKELIASPQLAAEIGRAAQERTLRDYGYSKIFRRLGERLCAL